MRKLARPIRPCPDCGDDRLSYRARNRAQANGWAVYCKRCAAARQRTYRGSARGLQQSGNYYQANRQRVIALVLVRRAVVEGKLVKPFECQRCGNPHSRLQAHHYLGYGKEHRLTVRWLCPYPCHKIEEENIAELGTTVGQHEF